MLHLLQLNDSELKTLVLNYCKSQQFIEKFGQKTVSNIQIDFVQYKKFIVEETLTDNQFYFGYCNGSFASVNYTTSIYTPTCSLELKPLVGPNTIISYLPNNELLLFNYINLIDTSVNFIGYLITIN